MLEDIAGNCLGVQIFGSNNTRFSIFILSCDFAAFLTFQNDFHAKEVLDVIFVLLLKLTLKKIKLYISHLRPTLSVLITISDALILRSDCIRDLGVMLDSKLYFHCHVDFVYSQALRTLGLIRLLLIIFLV
jgi:hypothetical protein